MSLWCTGYLFQIDFFLMSLYKNEKFFFCLFFPKNFPFINVLSKEKTKIFKNFLTFWMLKTLRAKSFFQVILKWVCACIRDVNGVLHLSNNNQIRNFLSFSHHFVKINKNFLTTLIYHNEQIISFYVPFSFYFIFFFFT